MYTRLTELGLIGPVYQVCEMGRQFFFCQIWDKLFGEKNASFVTLIAVKCPWICRLLYTTLCTIVEKTTCRFVSWLFIKQATLFMANVDTTYVLPYGPVSLYTGSHQIVFWFSLYSLQPLYSHYYQLRKWVKCSSVAKFIMENFIKEARWRNEKNKNKNLPIIFSVRQSMYSAHPFSKPAQ